MDQRSPAGVKQKLPGRAARRAATRAGVAGTVWDLGYRWTHADIELSNVRQPHLRRSISWADMDIAPEFPVLDHALVQLCTDPEWQIVSVQVASYDMPASHGPVAQLLNHSVN